MSHEKPKSSPITNWRSAHRARSHDSAHAEDDSSQHHDHAIDHPQVPSGPADLIIEQDSLDALVEELRAVKSFAYDTEFIGELTYHPLLCLIQVATTKRIALIDPMIELDLGKFWALLADESVEKILHAGQQDVEPVARILGAPHFARNVVDTQIVAGFVGMAYPVALSKLVLEVLAVKLKKGMTFTHWDQRPLSGTQLKYAADDVRFLPAMWEELKRRLDVTGHKDWALAECAQMCDPAQFGFNPETSYQRVRGAGSLHGTAVAVLKELTIWRDAAAREHNVPARALLRDEVMIDLARSPVKDVERLQRVRGLPRPVESQYGQKIVEATLRALSAPRAPHAGDRALEPSPTERFAADALFAVACAICAANSIDAALVTSRSEIGDFLRRFSAREKLDELHLMQDWREEALGQPLVRFLRGEAPETNLGLSWRDGKLLGRMGAS